MRSDQIGEPDRREPETVRRSPTEDDIDVAATYIGGLLNRMLGDLPQTDNAYTSTAALDNGRLERRRFTGYYCWHCGHHIWSDQGHRRHPVTDKVIHASLDDCG